MLTLSFFFNIQTSIVQQTLFFNKLNSKKKRFFSKIIYVLYQKYEKTHFWLNSFIKKQTHTFKNMIENLLAIINKTVFKRNKNRGINNQGSPLGFQMKFNF